LEQGTSCGWYQGTLVYLGEEGLLEQKESCTFLEAFLSPPYQLLDGGFKVMKARVPMAGIIRLRQYKATKKKLMTVRQSNGRTEKMGNRITREDVDDNLLLINLHLDKLGKQRMNYSYIPGEKNGYATSTWENGEWEIADEGLTIRELYWFFHGVLLGFIITEPKE
jgi:hypothetical protein